MATPIESFNLVEGINIDDSQFTSSEILAAQAIVRQYLSDKYSDLDLSQLSSLNDLVVRPLAQVFLVVQRLIVDFAKTNTLSDALNLPSSSSDAIVDALLSNFSISRRSGSLSAGKAKVVIKGVPTSISFTNGMTFTTSDGLVFSPESNFVAAASPTADGQLQLYSDETGTQSFVLVPLVAANSGSKYNLEQYTPFTVDPLPFQMISAMAFSAFSGGDDSETSQEVIKRLIPALSARNLASPLAIEQTLRDQFPSIQQISIHGVNSPLMSRNSHNIFSIKSGCMCDVYVKTASFIEDHVVQKIATKIIAGSPTATMFPDYIGKYVVRLSNTDVPGNYHTTYISPQEDNVIGGYTILGRSRSFNKYAASGFVENSITTVQEGTYSVYSEEYIAFDTAGTTTTDDIGVTLHVDTLPYIGDIQYFVNDPSAQTALVDTMVKPVIPCIVETSEIKVRVKIGSVTAEALQDAAISYINSVDPKSDTVRIDGIISAIKADENVISVDTPILVTATILCPDENYTSVNFSTESILEVPTNLSLGYGPKNIGFFARSSTVPLTIIEV